MSLYIDYFLAGFTLSGSVGFDNWQLTQTDNLAFLMESAVENLTHCYKTYGDYSNAIRYARRWLALDRTNEKAHRELIDLYGKSGHRSAALKQYSECERILKDELGISPEEATAEIYENLKSNCSMHSPYQQSLLRQKNNLPTQTTSFIGREREKDEIKKLLSQSRLLTLTGAGGSGKTRLCLEVSSDLADQFKDGVWFVDLAPLSTPDFVMPAIAKVLHVTEIGSQSISENLKRYLQNREVLLILDNFEHVMPAARYVSELLNVCNRLHVMVTSREVMHLSGEIDYPVLPLMLPVKDVNAEYRGGYRIDEYEGIKLFIERAATVRKDLVVDEESIHTVAEICQRLDGLPLAIELAAAGLSIFQPKDILHRLEQHLPILAKGARDLPERQRTLQGAIDWSYGLLDESEQVLYRRLSVFAGGCTLEAAEAICHRDIEGPSSLDVFEGLRALSEKNLLKRDASTVESRFRMFETVREHALQRLEGSGESEVLKQRHLEFYVQLTESTEKAVYGPDGTGYIQLISSEVDNIRAALGFGREHNLESALRIAAAPGNFW